MDNKCITGWKDSISVSFHCFFHYWSLLCISCILFRFICNVSRENALLIHSVMFDSLWANGLQQARLPYPSPYPGACPISRPLSWWCHPTISSSVIPFYSCLKSFPALGSFPMSWSSIIVLFNSWFFRNTIEIFV